MDKILYVCMLITYIFITISCKGQYTATEKAMIQCINKSVNTNIAERNGKPPFDFYEFMLEIEQLLLKENAIENTNKEYYLDLLLHLKKNTDANIFPIIENACDAKGFDFNMFYVVDGVFLTCPIQEAKATKDGDGKIFYNQAKKIDYLMANAPGFYDKKILKELFEPIDAKTFDNIIYRAPIIHLVILTLNYNYNPIELKSRTRVQELKRKQKEKERLKALEKQKKE